MSDTIIIAAAPPPPDYNALVHFMRRHVQPPAPYYVTRDDVLVFSVWCPTTATTVNLSLRFQDPDGQVLPRFETIAAPTNSGAATVKVYNNAEGFLISASASTPGSPRGQCFVSLEIKRGQGASDNTLGDVLLQGYPGAIGAIAYPRSPIASALDGRGRMRAITVANPAAGADFALAVPAGLQWILRGVTASLATAIAVANRAADLVITDGASHVVLSSAASFVQAASLTEAYSWFNGANQAAATFTNGGGLPAELRMLPTWTVGSSTAAIAAADQWSAIVVTVEEFINS